ncbi:MAG: BtrH N-terminal domain-containing protein [Chloroflexota bacterium]
MPLQLALMSQIPIRRSTLTYNVRKLGQWEPRLMTILKDYHQFDGRHYETGSLHNVLTYQGRTISEELLLGISGGIIVGYFSFAYEGYDPHVVVLTRNTFDPFDRILDRIGIVQDLYQTTSEEKACSNLEAVLESGNPALVWVDMYSLPYVLPIRDDDMSMMIPVVVYGVENETVHIADRASLPLTVDVHAFSEARSAVKKVRYRLLAVDDVTMSRLPGAVEQGLHDTIRLFEGDVPVKPAAKSIGYAGMSRWADCLTKRSDRQSWQKIFPPGPKMYAGLTTCFTSLMTTTGPGADRQNFANFLDEAAVIIDRPALRAIASAYREMVSLWVDLADAHLPASVPILAEARDLLRKDHELFVNEGQGAQKARKQIHNHLGEIRGTMDSDFPLTEDEAEHLRTDLADRVLALRDREQARIEELKAALS